MTMRKWTLIGLGLAVSLMAPAGVAALETPEAPTTPQQEPEPRYVPLREVLPELSEQTGIDFQVPKSLQDELIPWREDGKPSTGWIRDHSRVELWDEQTGNRKIILMESDPWAAPATQKPTRVKRPISNTYFDRLNPDKPKSILSKKKLRDLIKRASRHSIPLELYEDEEYRAFFSTLGVHTSEDLKNRKTVTKIRMAVRKLLLQMKVD